MNGSERLRAEFSQPEIADGWEILAEGDGNGCYGYGSRDLLMYLRGPDGLIYCQEASCCSCNGIEGAFDPVETNIQTIRRDLASYEGKPVLENGVWRTLGYGIDTEKARVAREALEKLRSADSSSEPQGEID